MDTTEDFPNATKAYRQGLALPIGLIWLKMIFKHIAGTLINILDSYETDRDRIYSSEGNGQFQPEKISSLSER